MAATDNQSAAAAGNPPDVRSRSSRAIGSRSAHVITIGPQTWTTKSAGTVVHTERGRHGLHFRRNFDDKVFSDFILLRREDGELTTVALDEFTTLRRL